MTRRVVKRLWHELDLICATGIGVEALAPSICRLLREIVGADAGALFWVSEEGLPLGFFHEDTSLAARNLFVNSFSELFASATELNVLTLVRARSRDCGHLLAPPEFYWRSNTYNLLVRASGHRHTLDLRVDHDGRARAMIMLFRAGAKAFGEEEAALLKLAGPLIRRAFQPAAGGSRFCVGDHWSPQGPAAFMVVDRGGRLLRFFSGEAQALLSACNLMAEGVPLDRPLETPPLFARLLCQRLGQETAPMMILPTARGRLRVTAERLGAPSGDEEAVLLTLQPELSERLAVVMRILDLDLSPKQRSILLAGASGASRAEVAQRTGTSPEALKKHLAAIFNATGLRSWQDLQARFGLH